MSSNLLVTKLYIPPARKTLVPRPRLLKILNEAWQQDKKLALVSASAGYGKTTLVIEWLGGFQAKSAWLGLDKADNDPARFLAYLIAALQQVDANIGKTTQAMLQSPQPLPPEIVLTSLVNEIALVPTAFTLVLDDYHVIEALPIHQQLGFLVEHQPPQMHLIIITREDPPLPLARLRVRSQIVEIRQDDLRFLPEECADFLQRVMVYGSIRLSFFHPQPGTVRVHQIIEADDWPNDRMVAELPPLLATDPETFERITTGMHQKYIKDTIQEARAGAQIVVWPEVAGLADEKGTAALLARGKEVARQEGIYLVMPLYTVYPDPKQPVDNRLIIVDPAGEVVLEHEKYGCTAFNLSQIKLTAFDTPYGKMSAVMCCDLDFPTVISQAGRKGVDILFVPSNEPLASIVQMHVQQAPFRVIENGFSLVRPTKSGVSLYTDPYGRVLAMTDQRLASSKVLVVQVPTHRVATVYSIAGDLFGWLTVAGFVIIVVWAIFRGRKNRAEAAASTEAQAPSA